MCRMLAKASALPGGIMRELEQCPNSLLWLSENGIKSHDPSVRGLHNDGCGMAYISDQGTVESIRRGKENFWDREYHDFAQKARSKLYIAHNRFASEGLNTSVACAHPFIMEKDSRQFAFCHNGGVQTFFEEAQTRAISDSQLLMEHLIDNINESGPDSIVHAVESVAASTSYSSLCAFLLTPSELYAWRIFNENDPEEYERLSRYYTLYINIAGVDVTIASEPLDEGSWFLMPNKTLASLIPTENEVSLHLYSLDC